MPARRSTGFDANRLLGLSAALVAVALFACATRPYEPAPLDSVAFKSRAQTQRDGDMRVTAAVLTPDEAEAVFGIPTYDRSMQPIWLEVENGGRRAIRFAPAGTDRNYFPPAEVWYTHRKGFSKQGDKALEKYLHDSAMPRTIPAGETRSGFVFTYASPGTKAFNVDLFGAGGQDASFTFFIEVPGFVPDHAEIDFGGLYSPAEVRDVDAAGLRAAMAALPWTTTDRTGDLPGLPVGLALIGKGDDVLQALLRAGWYETVRPDEESELARAQFLFGRPPDAVFRIQRGGRYDRNEVRFWLAPLRVEGEPVWLGQITHYIGRATQIERALFEAQLDPDMDDGRNFMLQVMWYSQSLLANAWLNTGEAVPVDQPRQDYRGASYFSDGVRSVLWLSGSPVSLLEADYVAWDEPLYR